MMAAPHGVGDHRFDALDLGAQLAVEASDSCPARLPHHHQQLFAAVANCFVLEADAPTDRPAELGEDVVAGCVTVLVVDSFEVVDVDEN